MLTPLVSILHGTSSQIYNENHHPNSIYSKHLNHPQNRTQDDVVEEDTSDSLPAQCVVRSIAQQQKPDLIWEKYLTLEKVLQCTGSKIKNCMYLPQFYVTTFLKDQERQILQLQSLKYDHFEPVHSQSY